VRGEHGCVGMICAEHSARRSAKAKDRVVSALPGKGSLVDTVWVELASKVVVSLIDVSSQVGGAHGCFAPRRSVQGEEQFCGEHSARGGHVNGRQRFEWC
jgi:hypothetical protein